MGATSRLDLLWKELVRQRNAAVRVSSVVRVFAEPREKLAAGFNWYARVFVWEVAGGPIGSFPLRGCGVSRRSRYRLWLHARREKTGTRSVLKRLLLAVPPMRRKTILLGIPTVVRYNPINAGCTLLI